MTTNPHTSAPRQAPSTFAPLRRSTNRMLGGVCAGVAEYFKIDPTLVRVLFAVGAVITGGALLLVYPVLYLIMPVADGTMMWGDNRTAAGIASQPPTTGHPAPPAYPAAPVPAATPADPTATHM